MASEGRYIVATKILITDAGYVRGQRPGATATSQVYERFHLPSTVPFISWNILTDRLSRPAVATPAAVTPGAITPAISQVYERFHLPSIVPSISSNDFNDGLSHHEAAFAMPAAVTPGAITSAPTASRSPTLAEYNFLPPSYPIEILICFLLILALSLFGFSISKSRAVDNKKKWGNGDNPYNNAADTDIPLTDARFRGEEQSPLLSSWFPGQLLDFQRPVSPIIVYQADVVDDPGSGDEHSAHISVSSPSNATQIKSESSSSSSPIRGTRGRPITLSDSDASVASKTSSQSVREHVNTPPNRQRPSSVLANLASSALANLASSSASSPRVPSGSPPDDQESPNYGPRSWLDLYSPGGSPTNRPTNPVFDPPSPSDHSCSSSSPGSGSTVSNKENIDPGQGSPTPSRSTHISNSSDSSSSTESRTALQRYLDNESLRSEHSWSESQEGPHAQYIDTLLRPLAAWQRLHPQSSSPEPPTPSEPTPPPQQPRVVVQVRPLRRGAPRAGRRAPERFAESELSVWKKR